MITPLPFGGGEGEEPAGDEVGVTSVITPLPSGEGTGEGPAGAGGEASVRC